MKNEILAPAPATAKRDSDAERKFERVCAGIGMMTITMCIFALSLLAASCLGGCALERADPAARSARASYGAISLVASGDHSTCTLNIGDGASTLADGEGAIHNPSSFTTTQSPEFSGSADPVTAGITAIGRVATAGINAYAAKSGAKTAVADTAAKSAAADSVPGDTSPGSCTGDDCSYSGDADCTGGDCSYAGE